MDAEIIQFALGMAGGALVGFNLKHTPLNLALGIFGMTVAMLSVTIK